MCDPSNTLSVSLFSSQGVYGNELVLDNIVAQMVSMIKNTPNWKDSDQIIMTYQKIQSPPGLGPTGSTILPPVPPGQEMSGTGSKQVRSPWDLVGRGQPNFDSPSLKPK